MLDDMVVDVQLPSRNKFGIPASELAVGQAGKTLSGNVVMRTGEATWIFLNTETGKYCAACQLQEPQDYTVFPVPEGTRITLTTRR